MYLQKKTKQSFNVHDRTCQTQKNTTRSTQLLSAASTDRLTVRLPKRGQAAAVTWSGRPADHVHSSVKVNSSTIFRPNKTFERDNHVEGKSTFPLAQAYSTRKIVERPARVFVRQRNPVAEEGKFDSSGTIAIGAGGRVSNLPQSLSIPSS